MWFWQRKGVRKRWALWFKLLSLSAVVHVTFLLCLLFVYRGNMSDLFLEINSRNLEGAPVVLKSFAPQLRVAQKTPAKKISPIVKKPPVKKVVQKKVVPPKPKAVPKTTVVQKEPIKKIPPKKPEPKKVEQKVAAVQPKQKEVQEHKKAAPVPEKKVVQAPQKVEQKIPEQKEIVEQQLAVTALQEQADVSGIPEHVYALQQQISKQFKPPVGIAQDVACQIKIMIGFDGTMHDVGIEQSSGILMYDVAARSAMHKLALPRWTWGKSLTITFKQ